ncbi:MAG: YggS family pyridoxal phosphate-dependent enzyme [Bacteroidales bacterium]
MNTVIQENLQEIKKSIPSGVELVAVSKFHPVNELQQAYDAGQRVFGESKVQELVQKQEAMPKDIRWHFIGHLQTNKVKYITPFIDMIHSVDSLRLLNEINKEAFKANRVVDVLLQIHIATEQTKFGFSPKECLDMLRTHTLDEWKNIRIRGVMGMATFTDDTSQIRKEFQQLTTLFKELKSELFAHSPYFNELSFGMSDDYLIAIEEGSTLVRIGSSIFGARNY